MERSYQKADEMADQDEDVKMEMLDSVDMGSNVATDGTKSEFEAQDIEGAMAPKEEPAGDYTDDYWSEFKRWTDSGIGAEIVKEEEDTGNNEMEHEESGEFAYNYYYLFLFLFLFFWSRKKCSVYIFQNNDGYCYRYQ